MKHILLAGWILSAFFTVPFALTAGEKGNYAELKTGVAPQWGNLKNADIIPCPKEITIYDRNIAIASPWSTSSAGRERLRGIIAALNEAELKPVYVTSQMGYGYSFGLQATAEIMENSKAFTAIIASNDMAAWGCIDELKKHNFLVPEDISVAGADGLKIPGEVQVSSFYSPSYEIGKLGAEILLKQLDGVRSIENICLPVTPVAGNTIKSKLKPKKKGIES
jgi:DNA-binding LacI/PurR family transcriptional regulator